MTIEVRAVRVNTPSPIISKELGNVIEGLVINIIEPSAVTAANEFVSYNSGTGNGELVASTSYGILLIRV